MMEKNRFGLTNLLFCLLLFIAGGASAQSSTAQGLEVKLSRDHVINGSLVVIHVHFPSEYKKTVTGEYEGIQLPFYPSNNEKTEFEAILGVSYDEKPGTLPIKVKAGEQTVEVPLTVTEGQYPAEILKVDNKTINIKKKYLARIEREQKVLNKIYATVTPHKYWTGPFQIPIESQVTSLFGTKRVYNGERKSYHGGLDLRAAEGTPVHAGAAGEVVLAQDLFFTGNTVILDHGYGVLTLYFHMSKLQVKKGQIVQQGQVMGLSGKTGRVTGPHLHWQTAIHHIKINPNELLTELGPVFLHHRIESSAPVRPSLPERF